MKALMDLHTHTISSGHAYSTLKENIEEARDKGLKVFGVSDHAISMPGTAHEYYFNNLKVIKDEIMGVRVLKGIEANIMDYEGRIDVQEELALELDYVIASMHPPCITPGTIEENTNALIKVMDNPYVKIIGHPDDSRFPLDYEKVVLAAKEKNMVFEMNNTSISPKSFRRNARENQINLLNLCKKHGVKIIMGSDAHIYYDVGEFSSCYELLKEIDFPEKLVLNFNMDSLEYILGKR
ncbi:phosphatase [uncultured Clostridium sp.]|uniref:phosphatase n=1 Tax=uncultured Clostridium sp. TaxID=59620 RepID=UPI0032172021